MRTTYAACLPYLAGAAWGAGAARTRAELRSVSVDRRWYPCWGSLLPLQEQLLCPEPRHPAHPATSRDKSAWVQPPVGYRLARSTEVTSQVDTPVLSTCVPRQRCHAVRIRWTCAALAIANQNLVDLRSPGPAPQKTFEAESVPRSTPPCCFVPQHTTPHLSPPHEPTTPHQPTNPPPPQKF